MLTILCNLLTMITFILNYKKILSFILISSIVWLDKLHKIEMQQNVHDSKYIKVMHQTIKL